MLDEERQIQKAASYAGDVAEASFREYLKRHPSLGDSPIERALALHLLGQFWTLELMGFFRVAKKGEPFDSPFRVGKEWCLLIPQAAVGSYRADFVIAVADKARARHHFAVECDGHDFHEKTKDQAAHDKKRDRYFASNGLRVFHFTGSEIWRNAPGCADEVVSAIFANVRIA